MSEVKKASKPKAASTKAKTSTAKPKPAEVEKDDIDVELDRLLTPEEFDFLDFVDESVYPEDEFTIYLNQVAVYELERTIRKIQETAFTAETKELDRLEKKVAELQGKIKASTLTFKVKGISSDLIIDIKTVAEKKFFENREPEKSATNKADELMIEQDTQLELLKFFNASVLAAHVEYVERADGQRIISPSPAFIQNVLDKAPDSQKEVFNARINALRVSAERFQNAVNADFLAKP